MKACPLMLQARFLTTGRTKSLIQTIYSGSLSVKKKIQKQEDDEISDEQEDQENEDDESAYDGDNDEDQDFLIF